jgi:hypothetical protein
MLKYKLLFVLVFSFTIFSQTSYLEVSLHDGGDFSVIFDNMQLSAGNYAEFDNITPGEHYMKIIREEVNVPPQANVVFEGKIKIPAGYDNYAVIDEYGQFIIYKKVKYGKDRLNCESPSRRKCGEEQTQIINEQKTPYTDFQCKSRIIKEDDFSKLKKSINNRNFEISNLDILKEAIDKNYFLTEHIIELMWFFTFEDNKLEIAKYSYSKVCDKNNFSELFKYFSYESSVKELKDYISGK